MLSSMEKESKAISREILVYSILEIGVFSNKMALLLHGLRRVEGRTNGERRRKDIPRLDVRQPIP